MWLKLIFTITLIGIVSIVVMPSIAITNEISFFNSGIDYWNENKKEDIALSKKPDKKLSPAQAEEKFNWKRHLDPNNKDFFREGEYTPPEPFMELVRNPTDENIKNWFAMIEKKNELTSRMMSRIDEYLAKNPSKMEPQSKAVLVKAKESLQNAPLEINRYRFRFYFDSQCPHCHHMFATISDLQARGFYVEAFQVDKYNGPLPGLDIAVIKASKDDVEKHKITSVPFLLIGDMQKKAVYRLSGYQSTASVFEAINSHLSEK